MGGRQQDGDSYSDPATDFAPTLQTLFVDYRSVTAIPLIRGGSLFAVLSLYSRRASLFDNLIEPFIRLVAPEVPIERSRRTDRGTFADPDQSEWASSASAECESSQRESPSPDRGATGLMIVSLVDDVRCTKNTRKRS